MSDQDQAGGRAIVECPFCAETFAVAGGDPVTALSAARDQLNRHLYADHADRHPAKLIEPDQLP